MKFESAFRRHMIRRAAYSRDLGPQELWSVIDQWPLYCGQYQLSRHLAIIDLVREILGVPGDVAEFGTWRGATAMLVAKVLHTYQPHDSKMVHCFDTFHGLEDFLPQDGPASGFSGEWAGSAEELRAMIRLHELEDAIVVHRGRIEETLPQLLAARPELSFCFAYCDADLYGPTAAVLEHLPPRLLPGGLLAFDEWNCDVFPGEGIAVGEFLSRAGPAFKARAVSTAAQPSLVLEKKEWGGTPVELAGIPPPATT